ncbi:tetratricopeptide repeat protein [bacterium]|nr:tetratricopeptide repeat protein [bacterium]
MSTSPRKKGEGLALLDPFLGRRQAWSKQADQILAGLPDGPVDQRLLDFVESVDPTADSSTDLTNVPVRSKVVRDVGPCQTLGSRLARHCRAKEGWATSWTSLARQPRLARLPLLVRKTVLELRPIIGGSSPVPDRLEECFDWLRATLIASEKPVVIIWDGIDLAESQEEAGSWFWFTSPWPPNVRLVATISPSKAGDELADLWSRCDVSVLNDVSPLDQEKLPDGPWSKRAREVAGVLSLAVDGRSEVELTTILATKEHEVSAALDELRPWLVSTEEDRLILARLEHPAKTSIDAGLALRQTVDFLTPLAKKDRSMEAEVLGLLVRSGDPAHRQAARRYLQSHPLIGHLWSRDRADLYEMARTWEKTSPGAWQHLAESARTASGVEAHHLVAYGDVFEALGDLEAGREFYAESAERARASGAVFHEMSARRRAADCSLRLHDYEGALDFTPPPLPQGDLRQRGSAMILRAEAMAALGRTKEAWEILSDLEKQSFEANSAWHQIESLSRQATLAEEQNDVTAAANIDAQILILGRTAPVGLPFVNALAREAKRKLEQKDEPTAQVLATELHRSAVVVASAENVGLALGMLASLADRRGESPLAAHLLAAKEKLCRQIGDLPGVTQSMILRAGVLGLRLNQGDQAREILQSAQRIASTIQSSEASAQIEELTRLLEKKSPSSPS